MLIDKRFSRNFRPSSARSSCDLNRRTWSPIPTTARLPSTDPTSWSTPDNRRSRRARSEAGLAERDTGRTPGHGTGLAAGVDPLGAGWC